MFLLVSRRTNWRGFLYLLRFAPIGWFQSSPISISLPLLMTTILQCLGLKSHWSQPTPTWFLLESVDIACQGKRKSPLRILIPIFSSIIRSMLEPAWSLDLQFNPVFFWEVFLCPIWWLEASLEIRCDHWSFKVLWATRKANSRLQKYGSNCWGIQGRKDWDGGHGYQSIKIVPWACRAGWYSCQSTECCWWPTRSYWRLRERRRRLKTSNRISWVLKLA